MSWGIVCTAKASPEEIARFVAHHLSVGCTSINIYLDAPNAAAESLAHPALQFYQGTQAHEALNQRQMANATEAYAQAKTDWLAHIDLDEFILPTAPLAKELAALSKETEWARLLPVEALASDPPLYFKRAPQHAGLKRSLLEDLYPDYGLALRTGFISHSEGKASARTGLKGARMGVHILRGRNKPKPATLAAHLAHTHALTWEDFIAQLPRRLAGTSYTAARNGDLPIGDLLRHIEAEDGIAGLKCFYTALRAPDRQHLTALKKHGLLIRHDLQLDAKARKLFPNLESLHT